MWVDFKKAPNLMIAEMWKELLEGEGLPTHLMPEGDILSWGRAGAVSRDGAQGQGARSRGDTQEAVNVKSMSANQHIRSKGLRVCAALRTLSSSEDLREVKATMFKGEA